MANLLELRPQGSGNTVTISAGKTERVLDQANKGRELADSIEDPQLCTYAISATRDVPAAATADLKAVVSWATGLGRGQVQLDIARGCMLTLPSSWSVVIDVTYTGTGPDYTVSATAAYGTSAALAPVCSMRLGVINAGARSARFEVPSYARTMEILTNNAAGRTNAITVSMYDDSAGVSLYEWLGGPQVKETIISGAEMFDIVNGTPANLNVIASFELELG